MPVAESRFLDPEALAGIRDLELLARTVVEGFLVGRHRDPRPGAGVEFNQYRGYEPGEDPRRIDWKAYARSDRFYIREAEVERDVTVRFLLDASASMAHLDGPLSKYDYARFLTASLAYLVDRQGDRLALHVVRDGSTVDLLPHRRGRALLRFLGLLEQVEPHGRWPEWSSFGARICNPRERELAVVVSDLHQRDSEVFAAARALRALGHETLVLHLVAGNELRFDFAGDVIFEDLETGERLQGNAQAMRQAYLGRLEADLAEQRRQLLEAGVGYELLVTDQPLDAALRAMLLRRQGMR